MLAKLTKNLTGFQKQIDTLNRLEISRQAVLNNLKVYQQLNPDCLIFPVLKANAYGHGIEQVSQILKNQKLEYICVDSYYEYLKIKAINANCKTLIIGYNKPKNYKLFNFKNLAITVYDLESIRALEQTKKKIKIHLKVDTGLNRQGVLIDDLPNFLNELKKYSNLELEGVLTHLADADNPQSDDYSEQQIKIFNQSLDIIKDKGFTPKYNHLANSAGGLKFNQPEFNALRLGLGLYGYSPLEPNDLNYKKTHELKPCLRFISTLIQTKYIKKGAKISYNLTFEADKNMKIGIIPAGYYEGIDRRLSNKGIFGLNRPFQGYNSPQNSYERLPILGRICMNLCVCDLTNSSAKKNDEIIIINNQKNSFNSVEKIAQLCHTIPYEIVTKLSESIRRIITD